MSLEVRKKYSWFLIQRSKSPYVLIQQIWASVLGTVYVLQLWFSFEELFQQCLKWSLALQEKYNSLQHTAWVSFRIIKF